MTTNRDRAEALIIGRTAAEAMYALEKAGLLMPDLPEANDPRIFVPEGKGWCVGDVSVWTAPNGPVMVQNIEPGELTPYNARKIAYALLAAANHAEGASDA